MTATTTRNEAAERLLEWVGLVEQPAYGGNSIYDELRLTLLPEALAAERRATVERLRKALHVDNWDPSVSEIPGREERIYAVVVKRALDEEAGQ